MPVAWRLHVLEGRLKREVGERFVIETADLYGLEMDEQHTAIDAVITSCGEFPVVLVDGAVACVGEIDADAIAVACQTARGRWSKVMDFSNAKEQTMAVTTYHCEECGTTFEVEGGCCCQPAETATCPACGAVSPKKPEAPKPAGGCGCGSSCC